MEQELKKYLELVETLESYFEKAILSAQTQPNKHYILKKQFDLVQDILARDSNYIDSSEYIGLGIVNLNQYCNALINALKTSPKETTQILDAHKNILKTIKAFAELKWKFLETNPNRKLPYTYINTIKYVPILFPTKKDRKIGFFEFGNNEKCQPTRIATQNDYLALFKIAYTIDLINQELQAYLKKEKLSNWKKTFTGKQKTQNLSLIQKFLNSKDCLIEFDHIDITPLSKEFEKTISQKYIKFFDNIRLEFDKYERILLMASPSPYIPYGEKYYGDGLPKSIDYETPDLSSIKKPQMSTENVEAQIYHMINGQQLGTRFPQLLNPRLFTTMVEYSKVSKRANLFRVTLDRKKPFHVRFLDTATGYIQLMRFSRRISIKHGLKHISDKQSRFRNLFRDLDRSIRKADSYFNDICNIAYQLTSKNKIEFRENTTNKYLHNRPQTKHFLEKLTGSLKANLLHSFDQRKKYVSLHDRKQAIKSVSRVVKFHFLNCNLSEDEKDFVDTILDGNQSIEMQEKRFELLYLNKLLTWRKDLLAADNDDIPYFTAAAKDKLIDEESLPIELGFHFEDSSEDYAHYRNVIRRQFLKTYKSVLNKIHEAFEFDPVPYINEVIRNSIQYKLDVSDLDYTQRRALSILLSCFPECEIRANNSTLDDLGKNTRHEILYFYYKLFYEIDKASSDTSIILKPEDKFIAKVQASYQAQKKLYEDAMNEQEADAAEADSNATQNNIDPTQSYDTYDYFKTAPITPEDRLAQHNQDLFEQHQQKSEALRQQYTSQKTYVPLFEQLYLNQQVNAQQNVQNNIIQLQPRIQRQLAATGTDGFAVSSHARRSHNHIASIRQLPSAKNSATKALPSLARLSNFAHPTGVMIGGMYISRIIAYKATHNAKFADRISELSAYPIASALLYSYANNVGVAGGFTVSSRAALYYTATKVPPIAAAAAVTAIITTPFVQLKRYADMANYHTKIKRKQLINSVLFQAKQDPDYFAKIFYSHEEREDLFKEKYGVFSLNKTELQISRDTAFMDYELADTALSTITTMLDIKQDETLSKKKSVLLQIRSNALDFLKSTYPKPQSSNISFGTFDQFHD